VDRFGQRAYICVRVIAGRVERSRACRLMLSAVCVRVSECEWRVVCVIDDVSHSLHRVRECKRRP
jgi:hypothetical protein